jgi:hypothetical protein
MVVYHAGMGSEEEVDKNILRKFEIQQRLGKGVRTLELNKLASYSGCHRDVTTRTCVWCRLMASFGRQLTSGPGRLLR